ncbi:MAG: site-2 protease family protein [Alphaproteobacteria bacterium]|nr:site-2 protease family protein [Alphaproteobacteria bacterium]
MGGLDQYIIFAFIPLAIFIVLLVHELGHFCAARLFKFPVDEVVIGAGKPVWSRACKNGTRWSLRRYPIKAHVHVGGFEDEDRALWKKVLIILGGPLLNIVFPFFVFLAFFILIGQPATKPYLTGVEIGDAADRAGLQPGDEIIAVNGEPTVHYEQVRAFGYKRDTESVFTVKRGDQTFETHVTPSYLEFTDVHGVERAYPRLGAVWRQKPFRFEAIHSVNGKVVEGDEDAIRAALTANFDKDVVLGLNATDGNVRIYRARLYSAANPHIHDPNHEEYDQIFLGPNRDDFYYRAAVPVQMKDAFIFNFKLLGKVLSFPFQLLPIDKDAFTPAASVEFTGSPFINGLYHFIFKMALISFVVAYVNLLPLPHMDGSHLTYYALQAVRGEKPSPRLQARALAILFFGFYMAMMLANMDNLPTYIDSRLEKLHEFINTKTAEE